MAHDQPDNAERLEKLGVARWLAATRFKPEPAAKLLGEVLASPAVASACREARARLQNVTPLEDTCALIEGLVAAPGAKSGSREFAMS
jgi:UDP:flavonoid glycosyltransferase YjiC (YdhE family)